MREDVELCGKLRCLDLRYQSGRAERLAGTVVMRSHASGFWASAFKCCSSLALESLFFVGILTIQSSRSVVHTLHSELSTL